ncbi:MAG: glycoside hydrolase family 2 TIM barrel-domain containing protein [Clostridia bacterium]|nr:glycoside hydrolase family 2 TIM barrel-domain containing protein [Clostridia bacterium]
MKKICISKNWTFSSPDIDRDIKVDIPHDFLIKQPRNPKSSAGAQNGFFDGTWGAYSKYVKFGDEAHYILDIDGAYACARIYLNNDLLDMHPHGYTPYLVDISDRAVRGINNFVKITTQNIQPSTRWYSGAGVYRDVFLWSGGKVRIEPWDMFINTLSVDNGCGKVEFKTEISSDIETEAEIKFCITDADGCTVCTEEKNVNAHIGKNSDVTVIDIENAKLWDTENPYLYTVTAVISVCGEITDTFETKFGIRTISADLKNGFMINGKTVKLRGGCIHHDHGALGSAESKDAVARKIEKLKDAGFNSIRTSHYPPSLALLEKCDEEGIIIMDEAFDMWNEPKNQLDYSLFFRDWWDRDVKYMVMRDRNHPCVVSYSIGNEIFERNGRSDGYEWSRKIADEIRKYDSTKLVTSGICGLWDLFQIPDDAPDDYKKFCEEKTSDNCSDQEDLWAKLTKKYIEPLDIVGYNYLFERYEEDSRIFPERVIWGSETHALNFYDSWHEVMKLDNVIGDFTWTAYDNLGEAGTGRSLWARDGFIPGISLADYPWRTCYQGDLDLCGFRRPQSYFREAVWIGNNEPKIFTTHPMHYKEEFSGTQWHWYDVIDTWTFDDEYIGKPVKCDVYTDADEIMFVLNGKEIGKVKPEKAIASIDIPYEKGELKAIAFKDGKEQKSSVLKTTGAADKINVTAEKSYGIGELIFFDIEITDIDGNRIADASNEIECEVYGGELAGIFSGCPNNEDDYASNKCHVFQGRALAVIKHDPNAFTSGVIIKSDGLKCGNAVIK